MYKYNDYSLKEIDPEIFAQVVNEQIRQEEHIELYSLGKLHQPSGNGNSRVPINQQIC